MSFLPNNDSEYISSRITNKGRQKIAQGNFNIYYFQVGDSEFDYNFSEFDGTDNLIYPSQKILIPLDKDSSIKYPYKLSESAITGTTFGNPIQDSKIEVISNNIGAAGFVSQYFEYDGSIGSEIECNSCEIDIAMLNGSNILDVGGADFSGCEYITIIFTRLTGTGLIPESTNSLVYKIQDYVGSTLILDRNTPDLRSFSPNPLTVICNKCTPGITSFDCDANTSQQDPWTMNIVWTQKPAGTDYDFGMIEEDERLSGYTSNVFVSTKEFLGYTTSSGQNTNTGTTITNSFGIPIIVSPEEQHSIAILHYSEISTQQEPDKFFKYEDYIGHQFDEDTAYFEVYIPFIYYHRNTGSTIGARFFMDTIDYFINSAASDTKENKLKYRYLIDEQGYRVGKVFTHNKIVIFDDQEIVAILDYKSNRKYTLPIPEVSGVDLKYQNDGDTTTPLLSSTGETIFLTYLFQVDDATFSGMTGMHCNHYSKIVGNGVNSNISFIFDTDEFKFMKTNVTDYLTGFIANKFKILVQKVETGIQPRPNEWRVIDFTSRIPNHYGGFINPVNLRNTRFVVTNDDYENAGLISLYDLEDYLGELPNQPDDPSSGTILMDPEFGDQQPFPGSVKLVRSTDLQVMRFLINLPDGQFDTTQNPTYTTGQRKRITEIGLLDENKDVLVIGKTPKPIARVGTQVFVVKIDL